jgi:hypothetical protein
MARRRAMNDGSSVVTLIGLGAGAFAVYKGYGLVKGYLDQQKMTAQLKTDQGSTVVPPAGKKVFYDLNGKPIQKANLATIAADIEDALSYPTDQARAVRAFKSTPFGSVGKLEDFYLDKYKEPLRERMVSRLSDANWIKVKFDFR